MSFWLVALCQESSKTQRRQLKQIMAFFRLQIMAFLRIHVTLLPKTIAYYYQ